VDVNVVETDGKGAQADERAPASPFGVEAPSNVLLLGPSMGGGGDAAEGLLRAAAGTPVLLAVSLMRPPAAQVARWAEEWEVTPAEVAAIGTKGAGTTGDAAPELPFRSTTVGDPGDLTGLGIRVGECLDAWEDRSVVATFDSVTAMLQYAETKQVFQFLHVLTSRLKSAGALAGFHMDPGAHDERTVATVRSLFDGVYRRTDGEWERVG
jgi:hypothetical protein